MGQPIPVPTFGEDCDACFPVEGTTPEAYEIIFFNIEHCPNAEPWPDNHPHWYLHQREAPGRPCFYFYQEPGIPPGWDIDIDFNVPAIPNPQTELRLSYHRTPLPIVRETHFWSGHNLPTCLRVIQNSYAVCNCDWPEWVCGINGFAVCIPFPDPYPKKIITDLGWYDYDNWLYDRDFDDNGFPVYRLHHFDPWDTFHVKMDPTSPYS